MWAILIGSRRPQGGATAPFETVAMTRDALLLVKCPAARGILRA